MYVNIIEFGCKWTQPGIT